MDPARLWRTRVTWALLGAGATLAIVTVRERSEGDAEGRPGASSEASVEPVPAVAGEPVPESAVASADAVPTPVASVVDTPITAPLDDVLEPPPLPDVPAPAESPAEATPPDPAEPPAAAVEPYAIPLPLMPGARIMKRTHKLHEAGGTVHTLALHVPAPGRQVEAFYRSALAEADLAVSGGSTRPATMGSGHRSSLHGRGRDATVHVNLQQSAGTLRTIVRIIWRRLP